MKHQYFEITGHNESEVNRRVDEWIAKGCEVHARHTDHDAVTVYKNTNQLGRSKRAFDYREDRTKHRVVMKREVAK